MKNKIKSITVQSEVDECPDFSFLGEYTESSDTWNVVVQTGEYVRKIEQRQELVDTLNDWISDFRDNNADPDMIQRYRIRRKKIIDSGDMEHPSFNGSHYRYFKPYAGGEKPGTPEYKKYAMQDFERMEAHNNDHWCFIGIIATAEIVTENGTIQRIHSGGLWGIESDSGEEELLSTAQDEIAALKDELLSLGFSERAVTRAIQQWNKEIKY